MPHVKASDYAIWRSLAAAPAPALALGLLGLVPFVAAAIIPLLHPPATDISARALVAYGAVILSFIGGVRWGLAISSRAAEGVAGPLVISIAPSLVGWIAVLIGGRAGLATLALALAVLLVADLRLAVAPAWYRALRLPLTAGAVASLVIGMLA